MLQEKLFWQPRLHRAGHPHTVKQQRGHGPRWSQQWQLRPIYPSTPLQARVWCIALVVTPTDKNITTVRIYDKCIIQLKVDTGAGSCVLTADGLRRLESQALQCCPKGPRRKPHQHLRYNHPQSNLQRQLSICKVHVGCQLAQELGIIALPIEELSRTEVPPQEQTAPRIASLSKPAIVPEEYKLRLFWQE